MRHQAIGIDQHKRGITAAAHLANRDPHQVVQFFMRPRIPVENRDVEGFRAAANIARQDFRTRRALRVAVVLAHHQQGQAPLCGQVQRFVNHAFAQGPIADEGCDDIAGAGQPGGEREAGRHRHHPSLNAVAEKARGAEVLAAAASAADPGRAPHHFRHQTVDVSGSRQVVSVTAVVADHPVAGTQMIRDRDTGELLADAGVNGSEQLAFGEQLQEPLFEGANQKRAGKGAVPSPAGARVRDGGFAGNLHPYESSVSRIETIRAGTPITAARAGTSKSTTELAPICA